MVEQLGVTQMTGLCDEILVNARNDNLLCVTKYQQIILFNKNKNREFQEDLNASKFQDVNTDKQLESFDYDAKSVKMHAPRLIEKAKNNYG